MRYFTLPRVHTRFVAVDGDVVRNWANCGAPGSACAPADARGGAAGSSRASASASAPSRPVVARGVPFRWPLWLLFTSERRHRDRSDERTAPKDVAIAYILWFFLGVLGVHHFYLGKVGRGVLWLLTAGLFGIGLIVDLFTLPSQVRQVNAQRAVGIG